MTLQSEQILIIPTHRPLTRLAFERQFLEARRAHQAHGVDMPLVYVDEDSSNRDELVAMVARFPDVRALYFTGADVSCIYDQLAKVLPGQVAAAFHLIRPDGHVNYGNAYNKLYVVAGLLGATRIHRRDSDTYAQELADGQLLFPIDIELRFLDRTVEAERALLVGGGYTGKWSIDIDHLIEQPSSRDLRRFFRALSIPEHEHDMVLREHIQGNNAPYLGDRLEVCSSKEPDCGNVAMAHAFDYVPCSPVRYALGGDYFTFSCLIEAGFRRVYHNRAVVHAYTPCRYDSAEKLLAYWRATAALVVYQHFYRNYWTRLRQAAAVSPPRSVAALAPLVASSLSAYRRDYCARPSDLSERLQDFCEVIDLKQQPLVTAALSCIRETQSELVELIERSVDDHLRLIEAWSAIMATARNFGASAAGQAAVSNARVR